MLLGLLLTRCIPSWFKAYSAIINRVVKSASPDGKQPAVYDVLYNGGNKTQRFTGDKILPDPSSDPLGRGDDDDVEPMAFHESDEVIIKLRNKGFPFIDAHCET